MTTYPAFIAEEALLKLLDTQRTPEMNALLHEFLRTRALRDESSTIITDANIIAGKLLKHKKFPDAGTPDSIDVAIAIEAYLQAPNPSVDDLQNRYNVMTARAVSPGSLEFLVADSVTDANGYIKLANRLVADTKHGATPYSQDELLAIARIYEQFIHVRAGRNPWQGTSPRDVAQGSMISEPITIAQSQAQFTAASQQLSKLYYGISRRIGNASKTWRVKDEFHIELLAFQQDPTLPNGATYRDLASSMLADHKTNLSCGSLLVDELAAALEGYSKAYTGLVAAKRADIEDRMAMLRGEHMLVEAQDAYQRILRGFMKPLMEHGLNSEQAANARYTAFLRFRSSQDFTECLRTILQETKALDDTAIESILRDETVVSALGDLETMRPLMMKLGSLASATIDPAEVPRAKVGEVKAISQLAVAPHGIAGTFVD